MGKKNKKRDDYWGVDAGEQMAYVESLNDLNNLCKPEKKIYNDNAIFNMAGIDRENDINDFENRNVDDIVRNVVNSSTSPIKDEEEDFSNRSLMSMNINDNNSDDSDYDDYWLNVDGASAPETANLSISESAYSKYDDPDELPSGAPFAKVRMISFDTNIALSLGKVSLDDGLVSTTFDLNVAKNQYIEESSFTDISKITNFLYLYAITLKHPSAIFTNEEFVSLFGNVVNYDKEKFMFFTDNDHIFVYVIDTDSVSNFTKIIADYSEEDICGVYVTLAYAVGQLNEAFFVDTPYYLDAFMRNEDINDKASFASAFLQDEHTEIGELGDDDELPIVIVSTPDLQASSRYIINTLVGDDDDDEDDDDEDDEDNSVNEEEVADALGISDFKYIPTEDENEEIAKDLLTPEMTVEPKVEVVAEDSTSKQVAVSDEKVIKRVEVNSSDEPLVMNIVRK